MTSDGDTWWCAGVLLDRRPWRPPASLNLTQSFSLLKFLLVIIFYESQITTLISISDWESLNAPSGLWGRGLMMAPWWRRRSSPRQPAEDWKRALTDVWRSPEVVVSWANTHLSSRTNCLLHVNLSCRNVRPLPVWNVNNLTGTQTHQHVRVEKKSYIYSCFCFSVQLCLLTVSMETITTWLTSVRTSFVFEFRQFRDFTASSFKLILLRLIKLFLPQITKIRFQTLKLHLIYDTTSFGHLYFLLTFDLSNSCSVKFPI